MMGVFKGGSFLVLNRSFVKNICLINHVEDQLWPTLFCLQALNKYLTPRTLQENTKKWLNLT
jgi:hypothetical protein